MKEEKLKKYIEEISMGPFGSDIKVDNYISDGVPVLNGSNLTSNKLVEESFNYVSEEKANSLGKANAKRGDIVITHRGTLGQVSFIPNNSKYERYIISQSQFRVRFNKNLDPEYFTYLMKSEYGQKKLLSFKNHVGVPALAQATTNFKELKIHIHKISDQQKIAKVLSDLDAKIELNNRINAELEAMAKLVYEYWFVQFDFPDNNGKPHKSSGGEMVWNEELKRDLPEGWELGTLDDLAIFNPSLKIERLSEAPYLGMSSIPTNGYMTEMPEEKEFEGGIKFQNGDVVVARITPCLENGKTALITLLEGDAIGFGSTEFIIIRAKEKITTSFLAILSRSESFRNYAISKMTGTSGRKRVEAKEIAKFQLAIPPKDLLLKYSGIVDSYFEKMTINTKQNQELSTLRDSLLPMLMNGQVTVEDADEMVKGELGMLAEPFADYNVDLRSINFEHDA